MARKRKADGEAVPAPGHNAIQPDVVFEFARRIENLLGELDKRKDEHKLKTGAIREEIDTVYAEAKDAGIPKKEFKAVIKTRGLERKLDAIRSNLERDEGETFDQIYDALGDLADLPLGRAALDRAGNQPAA